MISMYINNELRDKVYSNNLQHGFWDNVRTYEEFIFNLENEFDEVKSELVSGRAPTEVYYKHGNKPEGAPTELADIIIFILDYFGGSEPQIAIDEEFLESGDRYYKNPDYYEKIRREKNPFAYFLEIEKTCRNHLALSSLYHTLGGNGSYIDEQGKVCNAIHELHCVIKLILEFSDIYGIDMEKELIAKIDFNNSRPKDYRKMGQKELLDTDPNEIYNSLLAQGYGFYKETENIVATRQAINDGVLKKREDRLIVEQAAEEKPTKRR